MHMPGHWLAVDPGGRIPGEHAIFLQGKEKITAGSGQAHLHFNETRGGGYTARRRHQCNPEAIPFDLIPTPTYLCCRRKGCQGQTTHAGCQCSFKTWAVLGLAAAQEDLTCLWEGLLRPEADPARVPSLPFQPTHFLGRGSLVIPYSSLPALCFCETVILS